MKIKKIKKNIKDTLEKKENNFKTDREEYERNKFNPKYKYRKTIFYICSIGFLIVLLLVLLFFLNKPKNYGEISVNNKGSIISNQVEMEERENKKNSTKNDEKEIKATVKEFILTEYNTNLPKKADKTIVKNDKTFKYFLEKRRNEEKNRAKLANLTDEKQVKKSELQKLDFQKIKIENNKATIDVEFAYLYDIDTGIEVLRSFYENEATMRLEKINGKWVVSVSRLNREFPSMNKYDIPENIDIFETVQLPHDKAKKIIDEVEKKQE